MVFRTEITNFFCIVLISKNKGDILISEHLEFECKLNFEKEIGI